VQGLTRGLDELLKPDIDSNIHNAEYSQPICTALQIALVDLLEVLEITPEWIVGHSSGEIAAA
jgi:acyl transferase domain-containing protein